MTESKNVARGRVSPVLLVAIALLLVACGTTNGTTTTNAAGEETTTTVAGGEEPEREVLEMRYAQMSDSLAYVPFYIAANRGYFEEVGLDVERLPNIGNSAQGANAAAEGQTDLVALGTTAGYAAVANGRPITSLGSLAKEFLAGVSMRVETAERLEQELGVTPESPIEDRIHALEGLTLASHPEGSIARPVFTATLAAYGMDATTQVTMLPLETSAIIPAAREGRADMYLDTFPAPAVGVVEGWAVTWINYAAQDVPALAGFYNIDLMANDGFLADNPEAVERFLEAMWMAYALIDTDPADAKAAVRESMPDMDEALFETAYELSLPAFTDGMIPSQEGFDRILELWVPTLDTPVEVAFDDVYDLTMTLATQP